MTEADQDLADLRATLNADGEDIVIRRKSGTTTPRTLTEAKVRGRVKAAGSSVLIGSIVQGKYIIVAINDPAATVPTGYVALSALLPLTTSDFVVVAGRELALEAVDDMTRRVSGITIGLNLQAIGR